MKKFTVKLYILSRVLIYIYIYIYVYIYDKTTVFLGAESSAIHRVVKKNRALQNFPNPTAFSSLLSLQIR